MYGKQDGATSNGQGSSAEEGPKAEGKQGEDGKTVEGEYEKKS